MEFSKIMVAFDGSELSKKALTTAVQLAKKNNAALEAVHVYQNPVIVFGEALVSLPVDMEETIVENAKAVAEEASRLTAELPDAKVTLKRGPAAVVLLEHAEKSGCDLIVMGSRGLSGIKEFVLGSVSHNIVQNAKVPVLIVK